MSKSPLEERILEKAKKAAAEILGNQEKANKGSLDALQAQGKQAARDAMGQAKDRAEMIRRETKASAQLEAKLLILKKKDELTRNAIDQAWQQLQGKLKDAKYGEIAKRLVQEGVQSLGLKEAVITLGAQEKQVLGSDMSALSRQVGDVRLEVSAETLNSLGGVKVTDKGRHVFYDNSWDARLERARAKLTILVSDLLFSEGQTGRPKNKREKSLSGT